ncbi:unnamed protein product [Spirodela intermedia]|uniref:Transcription repressor n=2 Tax=Spirodela intermedia TaxID=51605 RepID=A0A7I8KTD3_SPIIN|nr:unnamed protein product [Spirodela intermedia]CAA6663740.1 unnamed protein product [Spirodela intermedia]CAA7400235.1 unnamed protein product [Spirodela intermedia]
MSSSGGWKPRSRHPAVVHLGCGCRRRKLPFLFSSPLRKVKPSSSAATTTAAATATSPSSSKSVPSGAGSAGNGAGSVAVVVESADPYHDFRRSMIQMIVENEIYERDGQEELLRRFLSLNSASQHDVIFRAFVGICDGAFSSSTAAPPPVAASSSTVAPACFRGSCGGGYGLGFP